MILLIRDPVVLENMADWASWFWRTEVIKLKPSYGGLREIRRERQGLLQHQTGGGLDLI